MGQAINGYVDQFQSTAILKYYIQKEKSNLLNKNNISDINKR